MSSLNVKIIAIFAFSLFGMSEGVKITKQTVISSTVSSVSSSPNPQRPGFPQIKLPCACTQGDCGCCSGVILERFKQKFCANVTFIPEELAFHAKLSANGRILFENTLSGRNPPPLCARIPRFRFITLCLKFSNVYFAQRNLHLCMGLEADWEGFTIFDYSFDCIRFGANGVAAVNPVEGGGLPSDPLDVEEQTDEDYDDSARNVPRPNSENKLSCYITKKKLMVRLLPSKEYQISFIKP